MCWSIGFIVSFRGLASATENTATDAGNADTNYSGLSTSRRLQNMSHSRLARLDGRDNTCAAIEGRGDNERLYVAASWAVGGFQC